MKALGLGAVGVLLAIGGCSKPADQTPPGTVSAPKMASAPANPPTKEVSGRAAVQHGFDADVSKVNSTPVKITVEQLLAMRKKIGDDLELTKYPNNRVAPFETSTFQIDATIKSIKHEKDGDFYFVIEGDSGAQAIVEVPDPALCQGSPMLEDITKARQALDAKFHPSEENQSVNQKATILGVGYLGSHKHKGSGTFGASARLMPGTGISFPDSNS